MFARVMGKFNRSEVLYFKRCQCGKEQLGVDLLNPSKSKGSKNIACQNALKTAAAAAKTALADPTERATLEAGSSTTPMGLSFSSPEGVSSHGLLSFRARRGDAPDRGL